MSYSDQYDYLFRRYSLRFFGEDFDWHWFKAMAMAESSMNPMAISPAGAQGIMQLMPKTSDWMAKRLGCADTPFDPEANIKMGVAYAQRCWGIWKKEVGNERIRFMLASYNAGPGNIIKAQRRTIPTGQPTWIWTYVALHLKYITGNNALETLNYVLRVEKLYNKITVEETPCLN